MRIEPESGTLGDDEPDGQPGTIGHGIQGFSGAPTVSCTYTGAVSGNAYTVIGFYPPTA